MIARAQNAFHPPPGLWLCHVRGNGQMPIYIGRWNPGAHIFERAYVQRGDWWCFLSSAEIPGIRALGYTVRATAGLRYTRMMDLSGYVHLIEDVLSRVERGSVQEKIAKLMGVSIYGKMAENPNRQDVMYSAEKPGDEWHPFLNQSGDDMADLWEAEHVAYRAHQHIDVANEITATVRTRLYGAIARLQNAGRRVVHADTDGLISDGRLDGYLGDIGDALGQWRADSEPQRTFIFGRKAYVYGEEVRTAGAWGLEREDAARLVAGENVEISGQMTRSPWQGSSMFEPLRRTVSATID